MKEFLDRLNNLINQLEEAVPTVAQAYSVWKNHPSKRLDKIREDYHISCDKLFQDYRPELKKASDVSLKRIEEIGRSQDERIKNCVNAAIQRAKAAREEPSRSKELLKSVVLSEKDLQQAQQNFIAQSMLINVNQNYYYKLNLLRNTFKEQQEQLELETSIFDKNKTFIEQFLNNAPKEIVMIKEELNSINQHITQTELEISAHYNDQIMCLIEDSYNNYSEADEIDLFQFLSLIKNLDSNPIKEVLEAKKKIFPLEKEKCDAIEANWKGFINHFQIFENQLKQIFDSLDLIDERIQNNKLYELIDTENKKIVAERITSIVDNQSEKANDVNNSLNSSFEKSVSSDEVDKYFNDFKELDYKLVIENDPIEERSAVQISSFPPEELIKEIQYSKDPECDMHSREIIENEPKKVPLLSIMPQRFSSASSLSKFSNIFSPNFLEAYKNSNNHNTRDEHPEEPFENQNNSEMLLDARRFSSTSLPFLNLFSPIYLEENQVHKDSNYSLSNLFVPPLRDPSQIKSIQGFEFIGPQVISENRNQEPIQFKNNVLQGLSNKMNIKALFDPTRKRLSEEFTIELVKEVLDLNVLETAESVALKLLNFSEYNYSILHCFWEQIKLTYKNSASCNINFGNILEITLKTFHNQIIQKEESELSSLTNNQRKSLQEKRSVLFKYIDVFIPGKYEELVRKYPCSPYTLEVFDKLLNQPSSNKNSHKLSDCWKYNSDGLSSEIIDLGKERLKEFLGKVINSGTVNHQLLINFVIELSKSLVFKIKKIDDETEKNSLKECYKEVLNHFVGKLEEAISSLNEEKEKLKLLQCNSKDSKKNKNTQTSLLNINRKSLNIKKQVLMDAADDSIDLETKYKNTVKKITKKAEQKEQNSSYGQFFEVKDVTGKRNGEIRSSDLGSFSYSSSDSEGSENAGDSDCVSPFGKKLKV